MPFPSPDVKNPVILPDGTPHAGTVFLSAAIDHPRWDVGRYSYASAFHPPSDWASHLAPYLFPTSPDRLSIGSFCQIADGVLFITASANHRYDGFSTFPFAIFDGMQPDRPSLQTGPHKDTVIGHDVWIGQGARILPGARIGTGCIVGAGAVVAGDFAPYSVIGGNPARVIRPRFDPQIIARLLEIAWWDWPMEQILAAEAAICGGDIDLLRSLAPDRA